MKNLLFLAIIVLLSACKTKQLVIQEQDNMIDKIAEGDVAMSLRKGPCFGKCPVFEMSVDGSGKAIYEGKRFTDKIGKFEKQLTDEEYNTLIQAFRNSDFDTYPEAYESMVPDLPLVVIGYNGKTVKGKEDRPEKLMELEKRMDMVANQDGWTMIEGADVDGVKPENKPEKDYMVEEILVQPNKGTNLPAWLKEYKSTYGVRLVKKMGREDSLWLVSYDMNKISGDALLKIIKKDDRIKYANFNHSLDN
jgi:hypothetical protein